MSDKSNNIIKSLIDSIKEYLETRIELIKLKTVEKTSSVISALITGLIILFLFFVFILILSISIAIFIGEILGRLYYGFFIIAGIYLLTGIIVFFFRKKMIGNPVSNAIIRKIFK